MEPKETLCWHCKRTGSKEHINGNLVPKELKPCKWIRSGKLPQGVKYTENEQGYYITECPLYIPEEHAKQAAKMYRRRTYCVETGEVFESINAAAKKLGIPRQKAHAICNGEQKALKPGDPHLEYID